MITDTASHLARPDWTQMQRRAFILGGIGLTLCATGAVFNFGQALRSYLVAYHFWLGIALGCLAIVMLHHLTGGAWGAVLRPVLEAAMRTLWLFAALFLPLLFGSRHLYEWARPEEIEGNALLIHKSLYLNVPFFVARAAVYFAVWVGLAYFLNKWSPSRPMDGSASLRPSHALKGNSLSSDGDQQGTTRNNRWVQYLSAFGLGFYGLTVTFASIDWVMSLEPHWYSTIFGLLVGSGQVLSAIAFAIVVLVCVAPPEPPLLNDLGNLLLAFVMIWAYMAFSQFLLIWSGNLPEEIPWYMSRSAGGWQWVALALGAFYFALPFLLLLSRAIKRQPRLLASVAASILFMSFIAQFWTTVPAFYPSEFHVHWLDLATVGGLGGIWVGMFVRELSVRPLWT